jgi:hypothetical protein
VDRKKSPESSPGEKQRSKDQKLEVFVKSLEGAPAKVRKEGKEEDPGDKPGKVSSLCQ